MSDKAVIRLGQFDQLGYIGPCACWRLTDWSRYHMDAISIYSCHAVGPILEICIPNHRPKPERESGWMTNSTTSRTTKISRTQPWSYLLSMMDLCSYTPCHIIQPFQKRLTAYSITSFPLREFNSPSNQWRQINCNIILKAEVDEISSHLRGYLYHKGHN